jgi:hypothetical protein
VDKEIGYKKPPRQTQFKPGQSGNPNGRPKKKTTTFGESIERELNSRITVNEGGKRRQITKLQAIAKQQTNKAVNGDHKATVFVMKVVEPRQSAPTDTLSPVLYAMRAIHEKHEVANRNSTRVTDASELIGNAANDHDQADKDED